MRKKPTSIAYTPTSAATKPGQPPVRSCATFVTSPATVAPTIRSAPSTNVSTTASNRLAITVCRCPKTTPSARRARLDSAEAAQTRPARPQPDEHRSRDERRCAVPEEDALRGCPMEPGLAARADRGGLGGPGSRALPPRLGPGG